MSKHNETGIKGEQIAENFLISKGCKILCRNWRYERREVDVVAEKDGMLLIVEVKTRTGWENVYGFPEEAVSTKKENFLKEAAAAFMDIHREYEQVRFDIISISMDKYGAIKELLHIEDAFY